MHNPPSGCSWTGEVTPLAGEVVARRPRSPFSSGRAPVCPPTPVHRCEEQEITAGQNESLDATSSSVRSPAGGLPGMRATYADIFERFPPPKAPLSLAREVITRVLLAAVGDPRNGAPVCCFFEQNVADMVNSYAPQTSSARLAGGVMPLQQIGTHGESDERGFLDKLSHLLVAREQLARGARAVHRLQLSQPEGTVDVDRLTTGPDAILQRTSPAIIPNQRSDTLFDYMAHAHLSMAVAVRAIWTRWLTLVARHLESAETMDFDVQWAQREAGVAEGDGIARGFANRFTWANEDGETVDLVGMLVDMSLDTTPRRGHHALSVRTQKAVRDLGTFLRVQQARSLARLREDVVSVDRGVRMLDELLLLTGDDGTFASPQKRSAFVQQHRTTIEDIVRLVPAWLRDVDVEDDAAKPAIDVPMAIATLHNIGLYSTSIEQIHDQHTFDMLVEGCSVEIGLVRALRLVSDAIGCRCDADAVGGEGDDGGGSSSTTDTPPPLAGTWVVSDGPIRLPAHAGGCEGASFGVVLRRGAHAENRKAQLCSVILQCITSKIIRPRLVSHDIVSAGLQAGARDLSQACTNSFGARNCELATRIHDALKRDLSTRHDQLLLEGAASDRRDCRRRRVNPIVRCKADATDDAHRLTCTVWPQRRRGARDTHPSIGGHGLTSTGSIVLSLSEGASASAQSAQSKQCSGGSAPLSFAPRSGACGSQTSRSSWTSHTSRGGGSARRGGGARLADESRTASVRVKQLGRDPATLLQSDVALVRAIRALVAEHALCLAAGERRSIVWAPVLQKWSTEQRVPLLVAAGADMGKRMLLKMGRYLAEERARGGERVSAGAGRKRRRSHTPEPDVVGEAKTCQLYMQPDRHHNQQRVLLLLGGAPCAAFDTELAALARHLAEMCYSDAKAWMGVRCRDVCDAVARGYK